MNLYKGNHRWLIYKLIENLFLYPLILENKLFFFLKLQWWLQIIEVIFAFK